MKVAANFQAESAETWMVRYGLLAQQHGEWTEAATAFSGLGERSVQYLLGLELERALHQLASGLLELRNDDANVSLCDYLEMWSFCPAAKICWQTLFLYARRWLPTTGWTQPQTELQVDGREWKVSQGFWCQVLSACDIKSTSFPQTERILDQVLEAQMTQQLTKRNSAKVESSMTG